ncbi:MAG: hypothetical protein HRU31_15185 [Rhodobacteraceae bacterium]|nr:hypothetical protein [Paracoccaceae bacterium]
MISGRQALGSIEQAVKAEADQVEALESGLETLQAQAAELDRADLADFRELARMRLEDISRDEIVGKLDKAELAARKLIDKRDAERAGVREQIDMLGKRTKALGEERDGKIGEVEAIRKRLDEAEAATRAWLEQDAEFAAAAEAAQASDIQAANAEDKAAQSEADLDAKRSAYEDSLLFTYLWDRSFGTPEYSAMAPIRTLDGWVAGLIGYADARANYGRLTDIPKRLRNHATQVAAVAEEADAAVEALWQTARKTDGLDKIDAELEAAEAAVATLDDDLQAVQSKQWDALKTKGQFGAGEDEHSKAAVDLLDAELRKTKIDALLQEAQETLREDDDVVVSRIITRQDSRAELAETRDELRETLDRHMERLGDLRGLHTDFRKANFQKSNSSFRDGAMLALLLQNFLNGSVSRDRLMRELARQQRFHASRPKARMRPRRSPSSGFGRGFGGGGGFSTGGSFGGGGFKTGGGF